MNKAIQSGNYLATLLDADNRILSTGEARIYTEQCCGVFWPHAPADEDLLLKTVASVQTSDGHILSILKISRCPADFPPVVHYDFDFPMA
jgi:hypothetical protein